MGTQVTRSDRPHGPRETRDHRDKCPHLHMSTEISVHRYECPQRQDSIKTIVHRNKCPRPQRHVSAEINVHRHKYIPRDKYQQKQVSIETGVHSDSVIIDKYPQIMRVNKDKYPQR